MNKNCTLFKETNAHNKYSLYSKLFLPLDNKLHCSNLIYYHADRMIS